MASWLTTRGSGTSPTQHGTGGGDAAAAAAVSSSSGGSSSEGGAPSADGAREKRQRSGARIPAAVTTLPAGYQVRHAILNGIKRLMFAGASRAGDEAEAAAKDGAQPMPPADPKPSKAASGGGRGGALMRQQTSGGSEELVTVQVQGLGGSGKTIVACGISRDPEIAANVDRIVYVALGQSPVIRDLHRSMHIQVTGKPLDPNLQTDDEALGALAEAGAGLKVLLVLDDCWNREQVQICNFLDTRTASRLVITTRIKQLMPGTPEFELGVLEPDDAAALMLEVAGLDASAMAKGGYDEKVYEVCKCCGYLPLVLSIAGSMLSEYGDAVDDEFLALLKDEGSGGGDRVGEHGDEMVDIEDRLITSSLASYDGHDKAQVEQLFYFLACCPEDVPLPFPVLKALSPHIEGPNQKYPGRKIRSWTTALLQMSLLKGTIKASI